MFLAYSASLRSGSLARQVGAAIVSKDGDLIGVGCNDVPKAKGGLYWAEEDDHRDAKKGFDSNDRRKQEILNDTVERLRVCMEAGLERQQFLDGARTALGSAGTTMHPALESAVEEFRKSLIAHPQSFAEQAKLALKGGKIMEITEFGREVHAEMDAMLSCARVGASLRDATLYTTTFPCHTCARHIIAAGIARVVYIEPYPKSKAPELHRDAMLVVGDETDAATSGKRIPFAPFLGIGPRRFFDLFSMKLSSGYVIERKQEGEMVDWDSKRDSKPRVPMAPTSYIQREQLVANKLQSTYKKAGANRDGR